MESLVNNFWRGKKVLITGHTGFKGSWLSLWLSDLGAEVHGYALPPPTRPSLFVAANVTKHMQSIEGDIRDSEKLDRAVAMIQPEIVFHMAAQPLVRYSYSNPIETYMTNVMGTIHLFEAVRKISSVRALVNVTSDKCYENREQREGYVETDAMGGYDPYSSSKGCAELVTAAYRLSYFKKSNVAVASARAGNVIGGGDWAEDRLIPDIVRSFEKQDIVQIRNPMAIRPWQHVLEPLNGYLSLAQHLYEKGQLYATAFNFGPRDGDVKEVSWVVKTMANLWGDNAKFEFKKEADGLHEAHFLNLNTSKANEILHWKPRWTLEQALAKTVSWYQSQLSSPETAFETTMKQIHEYEKQL